LQKAIDEGRWAVEEFELQLNDPCGDQLEEYSDDEEENYTFSVLCESDDEADEADGGMGDSNDIGDMNSFGSPTGKLTNVEEINELLATDGVLDYSTAGKKTAKRRAIALKKQQVEAKKLALKKAKEEKAKKELELKNKTKAVALAEAKKAAKISKAKKAAKENKESTHKQKAQEKETKREEKELEKRRKKRERERMLREKYRATKKQKVDGNSIIRRGRKLGIADKRGRAATIVRGYLHRLAASTDLKGLGLSGVLTVPAASVESTGLLGMALAFRAAAGELEMPNNNDNSSSFKPWENIDVDGPKSAEERCRNLEKKIKMIERAIHTLDNNDSRRKQLIKEAQEEYAQRYAAIQQAEKDARQNNMPKRKQVIKKKDKQSDEKIEAIEDQDKSKINIDS